MAILTLFFWFVLNFKPQIACAWRFVPTQPDSPIREREQLIPTFPRLICAARS